MSIKETIYAITDAFNSFNQNRKINIEARNLGISIERVDDEINMFRAKHENLVEFVQKQTSNVSLAFSQQLKDLFEAKGNFDSWNGYFELVNESAKAVGQLNEDEDNFLSQLAYRTELLEDYYNSKNEDIQHLLDLTCTKHDVYNLCARNHEATAVIEDAEQAPKFRTYTFN